MRTKLVVNKSNIKNGKRNNAQSCPVALALKRMKYTDVIVTSDGAFFIKNNVTYYCNLPKKVQKFIKKFDIADKVEPFECSINPKECHPYNHPEYIEEIG